MHWGGVTVVVGAATVTLFTFSPWWACSWPGRTVQTGFWADE